MSKIISAIYDDDYNVVKVSLEKGTTVIIICSWSEDGLNTTAASRSELNWLLDNEPASYAELVLSGEMQQYLNACQHEYFEQSKNVSTEFMMYSKLM